MTLQTTQSDVNGLCGSDNDAGIPEDNAHLRCGLEFYDPATGRVHYLNLDLEEDGRPTNLLRKIGQQIVRAVDEVNADHATDVEADKDAAYALLMGISEALDPLTQSQ